ncbi:ATP-binding protein [Eubacterium sp.]|uniref:ATP-binding protein n=1 Tax=Eubacterium sp. TaxID=142586 RepID=UPI002588809D|nr:ATP-binding protein [Eubacterium sp.]MCR5367079.1 ATP-binding protein [Eubacterium sp.]
MYKKLAKLVMYRDAGENSILYNVSRIIYDYKNNCIDKEETVSRIYQEIRNLLEVATSFGFDKNLWRDYIAFYIIMNENPFSLTCERSGASDGSVNEFAKNDMKIFKEISEYDFSELEKELGIDCFSVITDYKSIEKREQLYNRNVSKYVRRISDGIASSKDENEIFDISTSFYKDHGVGMFGLNKAFRVNRDRRGRLEFTAIKNSDEASLDKLVGYEIQKKKLRDNTEAFVMGRKANNCLLYGDRGTGKSTSIKAIINEYYSSGLRMIEIFKHQLGELAAVISEVKNRNYKFIIYMDDLSFEDFETEYKYLKAVIEGGLEEKPDNVLIYATSNRRHLIKETWNDQNDYDMDKHHSDTMQEKLSLVDRFGVTINYSKPNQKEFFEIVKKLAERNPDLDIDEAKLLAEANKWEMMHGGLSGRTAQQFIDYMVGTAIHEQ